MTPKISVIIPVYNSEKTIENTLSTVLNQPIFDIEIILVNDGSLDNSAKICKEFQTKDERIILIDKKTVGYLRLETKA